MKSNTLASCSLKQRDTLVDDIIESSTASVASSKCSIGTGCQANNKTNKYTTQGPSQTKSLCTEATNLQNKLREPVLTQEKNLNRNKEQNKRPRLSNLDKFKRELIKALARLLLEEKKPEEEVWEELKKKMSCDCKLLLKRMSTLTIKKLKRLFVANDVVDRITKIAQLSLTDWFLFDMVLVHEDIDVIGEDVHKDRKSGPRILEELFALVVKYEIESLCGDELTVAWYNLTTEYNGQSRKCSPMLLQRRWYQVKDQARCNFYNFWLTYRGRECNLRSANHYKPNNLQMKIVDKYMFIVIEPFKTWEDLINQKRISLYSDFERLQLSTKNTPQIGKEPDVYFIDPKAETIDVDFDDEIYNEDTQDLATINGDKNIDKDVVSENEESDNVSYDNENGKVEEKFYLCDEDEVNMLESMYIPLEDNVIKDSSQNPIRVIKKENPYVVHDTSIQDIPDEQTDLPISTLQENSDYTHEGFENISVKEESHFMVIGRNYFNHDIKVETDAEIIMPKITNVRSTAEIPETLISNIPVESIDNLDSDNVPITKSKIIDNTVKTMVEADESLYSDILPNDSHLMEGIEIVDDGIEYVDEDQIVGDLDTNHKNDEDIIQQFIFNGISKIDHKLLLKPVVLTKKLDDMNIYRELVPEKQRVNTTSWLFRKLRTKSYNPIQLCKNPDFNTRLKRLTSGFFCLERNRLLLKACKPLTVDLHKVFESKLVNNTIYLKKSYFTEAKSPKLINTIKKTEFTISSSDLPNQNITGNKTLEQMLLRQSLTNKVAKQECIPEVCYIERNKVINLPNIDQICRTNEKLIIAEVSPIQISSVFHNSQVKSNDNNIEIIPKENTVVLPIDTSCISEDTTLVTLAPEKNVSNFTEIAKCDNFNKYNSKKLTNKQSEKYNHRNRPMNLTWLPGNVLKKHDVNKIPTDRLLTADTVMKIINMNKGIGESGNTTKNINGPIGNKFSCMKKIDNGKTMTTADNSLEDKTVATGELTLKQSNSTIDKKIIKSKANNVRENNGTSRRARRCCWARQRLKYLDNKIKSYNIHHKCPSSDCYCCCRREYSEKLKVICQHNLLNLNFSGESGQNDNAQNVNKKVGTITNKVSICCWSRYPIRYWHDESKRQKMNYVCSDKNCICCCARELFKMKELDETSLNLISNYESKKINRLAESQKNNKIVQISNKKDFGVNTDFDKDFEENFANNSFKSSSDIGSSTENPSIGLQKSILLSLLLPDSTKIDESCNTETTGPIISNVRSISSPSTIGNTSKNGFHLVTPKLSTLNDKHILKEQKTPITVLSEKEKKGGKVKRDSKVIFLENKIINNLRKKPICLGKNQILLYTLTQLNKNNMLDVTDMIKNYPNLMIENSFKLPILIPDGVRLALLPNQELVVSIDPGVQLDSSQIANLPNIIAAVQQQLVAIGVINKESITKVNAPKVIDVIQLSDDENSSDTMTRNLSQESNTKTNDIRMTMQNYENHISFNEINKLDASFIVKNFRECTNNSQKEITKLSNVFFSSLVNTENKPIEADTIPEIEKKCKVKNFVHNLTDKDIVVPEINNTKVITDGSNAIDRSKKTILSDLMEMSGISEQDATISNTVTSVTRPKLVPINKTSNNVTNTLGVNPLLNNPLVYSALLKCPDLNIVSSFDELKYVYKNRAYFYKMDIVTGIIIPINMCIRRQISSQPTNMINTFIDLTKDDENKNEQKIPNTAMINSMLEKNIEPKTAQHIKLQSDTPLLKKLSRKQNLKADMKSQIAEEIIIDNSESDDDEPLALKVKRKNKTEEKSQDTNLIYEYEYINNKDKEKLITEDEEILNVEGEKIILDYLESGDDEPLALKVKRKKKTGIKIAGSY